MDLPSEVLKRTQEAFWNHHSARRHTALQQVRAAALGVAPAASTAKAFGHSRVLDQMDTGIRLNLVIPSPTQAHVAIE